MADYKSDYLNSVLESYKMKHIEELINTYRTKRDEIKQFLNKQYGNTFMNHLILVHIKTHGHQYQV